EAFTSSHPRAIAKTQIRIAAVLARFEVSPAKFTGGATATGRIDLSARTDTDVVVRLRTNTAAVQFPESVVIPAGSSFVTFPVTSSTVGSETTRLLEAAHGGVVKGSMITITPNWFRSITLSSREIKGGESALATVTVLAPFARDMFISVKNETRGVRVPQGVVLPAGATSVQFRIDTPPVRVAANKTIFLTLMGRGTDVPFLIVP
ncbi:MAG TPA: hypothetical protein VEX38_06645, partial [Fimbriimonadaceae bacterium]|nr:hypothetical protein [Fimbriimonadaceae bacterium]